MTSSSRASKSQRGDAAARWLGGLVTGHPWIVIGLSLVLAVTAASGMRFLDFSNNYRVFFSPDNPDLVAFDKFQDTYTKNDNILFAVQPAEGDVFTPQTADAIEWLTREAWQIPYTIRVDSVTNFQHSWADGDDLTVEDLVRDGASMSAEQLARRRADALAEPLLLGNLISSDARTTGVNVTLEYPEKSITEVPEAVAVARSLASQLQERHPGVTVALTGMTMLNNAFAETGQNDAMTLMPGMFLVLVVLMLLVLRSPLGTAGALGVIGLSSVTALGLAGYAGITLDPISLTAPVIIMTLGIADSVHVLVTVLQQMRGGAAKRAAIQERLRVNLLAVAITSVTTVIGFLSLNFSDAPPYWYLGNITAVGIGAALLYSVFFLPAFLQVVPLRAPRNSARAGAIGRALEPIAQLVTRRHRLVLATVGTAALVLIALVPSIDLNDEFVKYFDHRIQFRPDAEWAIDNLTGIYLIEFSMPANGPGGINEPEYLDRLEAFTGWLRQQDEVTHVFSYADIAKRLNKNMHGDDAAEYQIPAERDLAAQYLLLYELSLPYGLDLNDRIALDKSATRVTATVREMPTSQLRDFFGRADTWFAAAAPPALRPAPTGPAVMFASISKRNIESMLRGNAVAIVLIAAVMIVALRSFGLGLLSLVPNAVPILAAFGVWAVLVRQVGMAAATVSATSLGIVVDDTVHFLSKYARARRENGYDRPQAIRYAFATVGTAVVSTTVILAFGFSVLAASAFRINAQMGLLTTITVLLALATDLLLLPALLMVGHRSPVTNPVKENSKMSSSTYKLDRVIPVVALFALLAGSVASAENPSPAEKGWEVAARADRSDRGFTSSVVDLRMILRNAAGDEATRDLRISTLEMPSEDAGDKSLVVFESPADIEGTALLSHARILDPDDQWLYLPALKRVKRISSVNKSGPFVGSEFAFEDFTALELEKYTYEWLREEPCGDLTCDVVARFPRYEHSGYTKQLSWVDQEVDQVRTVEFYDRRDERLKTLELTDYREDEGGWWRAHRFAMVNHQTGKSTDLVYSDYRFGTGVRDSDFVRGALQRVR